MNPPTPTGEPNKNNKEEDIRINISPIGLIGPPAKKNQEVDLVLDEFSKHIGHIPSDKYPRRVAQNTRQLINSFIKRNNRAYRQSNQKDITFDYVLGRTWLWYKKKDYASSTEKLETFKLKMKVFLDDIQKRIQQEGGSDGLQKDFTSSHPGRAPN